MVTKLSMLNKAASFIQTNIPSTELFGDLFNMVSSLKGNIQQMTVPQTGMYTSENNGIYYIDLNYQKQLPALNTFLYG